MDSSIDAKDVILDTKFSKLGEVEKNTEKGSTNFASIPDPHTSLPKLVVIAERGRVLVEIQDWATSIGFKLPSLTK